MVNIDTVKQQIAGYDVDINIKAKGDQSIFLTIRDRRGNAPPIIMQFVNQDVYAVEFLNNQFFELSEDELMLVLNTLLRGTYEVRRNLFGQGKTIRVPNNINQKYILPERTMGKADKELYSRLPLAFTLK